MTILRIAAFICAAAFTALANSAQAEIKTQWVEYARAT